MSDEIVGLSVLQPIWVDGVYRLWFDAVKSDGSKAQGWIFIRDESATHLPDKLPDYPEGCNQIWKFRRNGTKLDCYPSVNWLSWGFHNGYNWSTEYVELSASEKSMSKAGSDDGSEPPRIARGSAVHFDLNRTVNINVREEIEELKAQGALRLIGNAG